MSLSHSIFAVHWGALCFPLITEFTRCLYESAPESKRNEKKTDDEAQINLMDKMSDKQLYMWVYIISLSLSLAVCVICV